MYFLFLFILAFFLIFIFGTNAPIKLYHHYLLCKLANALGVTIAQNSIFSNVYSEINTFFEGHELKIRFVDGSSGSLKANSGLEIRVNWTAQFLMEFYRIRENKREWGDFKRFVTGEKLIDDSWFILTDNLETAANWWDQTNHQFRKLVSDFNAINQILINKNEIIVQLRRFHSCREIMALVSLIIEAKGNNTRE
jgi:hypothetical protein